jgi:WD40 repeat protein
MHWISSVLFSPDETRIVSGSDDKTIRLWDAATRKPLQGHTDWISSVSCSPDGTLIVSGSGDKTIWLWDAATGKPLQESLQGFIYSVSFSLGRDSDRVRYK